MQNSTKKIGGLLLIVFAFIFMPAQAANKVDHITPSALVVKDHLSGGYTYTAAGAPEGYDTGFILIVKSSDTYKVQVQTGGGVFNATNVEGKGHKIKFDVSIEGETANVALMTSGDKITGTSTSSTGVINITGVKSISAE